MPASGAARVTLPPAPQTLRMVAAAWAARQTGRLLCATGSFEVPLVSGEPACGADIDRMKLLLGRPVVQWAPGPESAREIVEMGRMLFASAHLVADRRTVLEQGDRVIVAGRYFRTSLPRLGVSPEFRLFAEQMGRSRATLDQLLAGLGSQRDPFLDDLGALHALRLVGFRHAPPSGRQVSRRSAPGPRRPLREPAIESPADVLLRRLEQDWRVLERSPRDAIVAGSPSSRDTALRQLHRYRDITADEDNPPRARKLAERCARKLERALGSGGDSPLGGGGSPVAVALRRSRDALGERKFALAREWAENALSLHAGLPAAMALLGAATARDLTLAAEERDGGLARLVFVTARAETPAELHAWCARAHLDCGVVVQALQSARAARAAEPGNASYRRLQERIEEEARRASQAGDETSSAVHRFLDRKRGP